MEIRLIKDNEFAEACDVMHRSIRKVFPEFYPKGSPDYVIETLSEEKMRERASWTHFYVAVIDGKIVGTGAIGAYWGSETESSLFNIFVDPDYHRQGIGREIVKTLEADEYALRAKRIEIPASMPAIPFYKKLGYDFKNDDFYFEDGHFALEKYTKNKE